MSSAASICVVAAAICGCAISVPIAPLSAKDDDVTGSISKPMSPLSRNHDGEDWRRARSAMGTALDPQGNGALVSWSNPDTGNKGAFTPVGAAYPVDGRVCRTFIAKLEGASSHDELKGSACRDRQGDWDVMDVQPLKKI